MRKISHRAKMYLRRENYLKGFLIEFDIIKRLKMADESGILLQYARWQVVDIDYVVCQLEQQDTFALKKNWLKLNYPSLALFIMKEMDCLKELMEYQKFCKDCEFGDYLNYSLYIHGWLIPWLDEQRSTGKISFTEANSKTKKGRKLVKKLKFYEGDSFDHEYNGEIDINRMACGEGTYTFRKEHIFVMVSGTWYKN